MTTECNLMIGGEAGQGVQSAGFILAKTFSRGGYHVFADQDYESRVRGGHNFFRIRIKDSPVLAINEIVDIIIALNKESITLHEKALSKNSVLIFDSAVVKGTATGKNLWDVPLDILAEKEAGSRVMANTVAIGAALGLLKYDFSVLTGVLTEHFGDGEVGKNNIKAARAGYDYALANYKGSFNCDMRSQSKTKRMLLNGNEAIALGALAAGCKFMSAYPMTPATSIMEYIASKSEKMGMVMVQAEDEIAAINMAIGAGFAGVRAMTATSGSGFCLMVEGLGLAGITETPVVIVDAQRPGPTVGLPTRTEQGDLQFAIYAHHGDFPRCVLAPATIEDAFWSTVRAFNIAEKYQLPVIILTDHHLASSYATVVPFDLTAVTIDRGTLVTGDSGAGKAEYKRHQITESGISPRAFPGQKGVLVATDSDEHDEAGHLIEDGEIRTAMVQKRLRKLTDLKQEIRSPGLQDAGKSDAILIGWGSSLGAINGASEILRKEGITTVVLHFNEIWPFPAEAIAGMLAKTRRTFCIESNAIGQFANILRAETGRDVNHRILKFDGRPLTPAYIVQEVKKELK